MGWGGTITQKGTKKNQHKSIMRNNESQKVQERDIFKLSKKSQDNSISSKSTLQK